MANPLTRRFWIGPAPWLIAAGALALWLLATALEWPSLAGEPVDPRPLGGAEEILALRERDDVNVLFVLIDTLRADRLQSYGYERPTSPFLDTLARNGVRFGQHLAQSSWTKCSMASLWTGLYPSRVGVTRFDDLLSQEAVMPAEIFRDAGFRTAGIWRNGWVEAYFGFDQGFEIYTRPGHRPSGPELRRENPTVSHGGTDLDLVANATEFLRVNGHERWFLYLHLMDVHEYTYSEETAKFGTSYSDIYDNSILHVNGVLDSLSVPLIEYGLLDKTLIVIGSDHGEAFGERGHEGHARNIYPETTEVPLILGLPIRVEPGIVIRQRTANVDLWPTVLDLLGLPAMEGIDGRSRVPEILAAASGEEPPPDETRAIAHLDQTWGQRVDSESPNVSVSEQNFRYVQFRDEEGAITEELFDRSGDAGELNDRLEELPEVATRLREHANAYLASEPPWSDGTETIEMDEMQLNQLRALGYALP